MVKTTLSGPAAVMAGIVLALISVGGSGCSRHDNEAKVEAAGPGPTLKQEPRRGAETQTPASRSVEPSVQSEIEKQEAAKRATLLADAVSALNETQNALNALDKGDRQGALSALERATGKLDLVVARDPKLSFAPVAVSTTVLDLYATPDTVRAAVKQAKNELDHDQVQPARHLVTGLASEADVHVTEIPLATYPAAIRAVVPLIDAGHTEEAKAALSAALNTLVVETIAIPLPQVRAEAMLLTAQALAKKSGRSQDDNAKIRTLIDATRQQLQLAEALGYGNKDSYNPLYAQLDEVQKETEGGHSGAGLFDKLRQAVRKLKFSV